MTNMTTGMRVVWHVSGLACEWSGMRVVWHARAGTPEVRKAIVPIIGDK